MNQFRQMKIPLIVLLLFFSGTFMLQAQNNTCATATPITPGTISAPAFTGGTATNGSYDAHHYSYAATGDGTIDISSCATATDTRLFVYDGCGGTQLVADDDGCPGNNGSQTTGLAVTSGTTYYIEWDDRWNSSAFDFDLTFTPAPSCAIPTALTSGSIGTTSASLDWTENGTATSWQVEYGPDGFTPGMGVGAATAVVTSSKPYSVSSLTTNTTYDFYVRAICGAADTSAWSSEGTFTTPCLETPDYTEDFSSFLNACWQEAQGPISGPTSFGSSDWTSDNFGNTGSNTSARFNIWGTNSTGWLMTPLFDLTGGGYEINLDVALTPWTGTASSTIGADDAVYVMQSTDGGTTWTTIYTWNDANSPSNTGDNISIDVSAVTSATTQFAIYAFEGTTSGGDYKFFIDNFQVRTPPACPIPSSLTASSVMATSASLDWTENGTATSWQVEYGPDGFTPGMGVGAATAVVTGSKPYSASSLTAETTYDFYVRAICGAGDTSAWSVEGTFTTPCNPVTLPWTENFDAMSSVGNGVIPDCMFESGDWTTLSATGTQNRHPNSGSNYIYTAWTADDWLITPSFTLTGGTSYDFSFYYVTDGNSGWTTLETAMGTAQNSAAMITSIGTAVSGPTNTTYTKYTATFTPASTGTYYLGIHVVATGAPWYMSFDDLEVKETPNCLEPSTLTASSITTTGASLDWTENGTATSWQVEYGPVGFTPGMGVGTATSVVTGSKPYSASSLMSATNYDFYVRAICGAGDTSAWSPKGTFTTLCNPYTTPYFEGFEAGYTDQATVALCLSQESVSGTQTWVANSSQTGNNRSPRTGSWNATLRYSNEDWLFIPINLTGGTTYTAEVYARQDGSTTSNSDVAISYGTGNTAADMTNAIVAATGIDDNYQLIGGNFTPTTTGLYYIGIKGYMNGSPWYISLDDISIFETLLNDVGITAATSGNCTTTEAVTIDITNFGLNTQTSIPVSYDINGGTVVNETWTGSLASGMTTQYTFTATYDASVGGTYNINASTALVGDQDNSNDATTAAIVTAPIYATPFGEDFEGNGLSLPTDWSYDGSITNGGHSSESYVIFKNMWNVSSSVFTTTLPKVGSVAAGDILKFDYQYNDYNGGAGNSATTLSTGDTLYVEISTDCGATFDTLHKIDHTNHVSSTEFAASVHDLSAYAGQTIVVRLHAVRTNGGDYYLDLDNFFIGAPLAATASVSSALACNGDTDGEVTATVTGGLTPYTYLWDDAMAQTSATATGLGTGTYNVTVTDAIGNVVTSTIALTEPTALGASATMVSGVSCNGLSDGSASVLATGGTTGYTYLWDDAMAQTTATATGLAAGTYNVIVTDANGCTATSSATVTEPAALNLLVGGPVSLDGTTWKMAPQAGAMGVGPSLGDYSWWANNATDVTTRACFFDDEYVF